MRLTPITNESLSDCAGRAYVCLHLLLNQVLFIKAMLCQCGKNAFTEDGDKLIETIPERAETLGVS